MNKLLKRASKFIEESCYNLGLDLLNISYKLRVSYPKVKLVRDEPKLLDDGGETPKSQRRGWRFNSHREISSH